MAKKTAKRVRRKLPVEILNQLRNDREAIEHADKPEILDRLSALESAREQRIQIARGIIDSLRQARKDQGLSLAEIFARAGIQRARISRLENAEDANPTLETLARYAQAVGKRLIVSLEDSQADV